MSGGRRTSRRRTSRRRTSRRRTARIRAASPQKVGGKPIFTVVVDTTKWMGWTGLRFKTNDPTDYNVYFQGFVTPNPAVDGSVPSSSIKDALDGDVIGSLIPYKPQSNASFLIEGYTLAVISVNGESISTNPLLGGRFSAKMKKNTAGLRNFDTQPQNLKKVQFVFELNSPDDRCPCGNYAIGQPDGLCNACRAKNAAQFDEPEPEAEVPSASKREWILNLEPGDYIKMYASKEVFDAHGNRRLERDPRGGVSDHGVSIISVNQQGVEINLDPGRSNPAKDNIHHLTLDQAMDLFFVM